MRRTARLALAFIAACLTPAAAQQPELSDQSFTRPAAGLTATLPVGATMSSYEIAGRGANRIILPGNTALVNVSDVVLTKAQTLREVADSIIRQRLASVSSLRVDPNLPNERTLESAQGRLLERETRTVNGWPCELFYMQVASLGGEDSAFGYALFMPTTNLLAMMELQTTAGALPQAKPYFELIVESAAIADPSLADAQRAVGVQAGIDFFQSLSGGDYERAIGAFGEDWRYERLFIPGPDGSDSAATELGYRRTRFVRGARAELKSREDRGNSSPADREEGYLVFQEARLLDAERNVIIDFAAGFFMTPDRMEEGWTIRQSVKPWKGPGPSSRVVETGVRDRDDMTVARSENGKPITTIEPAIEGAGYISRVETYLLPYLLMHANAPGVYRCYAFNQAADRVTLREDVLEQDPEHAGAWVHRSRPSETNQMQTTYFTSDAELVRSELPQDQLWEPVTLERLVSLWSSKGLPTE